MRGSKLRVRFFGKIQIRISDSKNGFYLFLGKSKHGPWMLESTPWVDSWDQLQIRIFEIHNLKQVFLTSGFQNKNGTQQMPYMYYILTEPMLLAP